MVKQGHRPVEIERRLGLQGSYVRNVIRMARANDPTIPMFCGRRLATVTVPRVVLDRLRQAGNARGQRPRALAANILTKVLDDDLIDAVLDEEE